MLFLQNILAGNSNALMQDFSELNEESWVWKSIKVSDFCNCKINQIKIVTWLLPIYPWSKHSIACDFLLLLKNIIYFILHVSFKLQYNTPLVILCLCTL